ncbi:hypothetical protein VT84_06195 [Gemmata sp. SH-PL17]|uniref:tetratricopeptide repeat protein n=1 Tax=Gemmata sp. SH-PL17 TaxID=1630693 RepID=UPI00078E935D|nr:tetratricopeptide repeat protein [Gemmata sp. SH-PL17]AMV23966.1 hypothetical protein VT84_06195 [Gemmata sp. SH-PL17]
MLSQLSVSSPRGEEQGRPSVASSRSAPKLPFALAFIGLFGVLLASFPGRDGDIWRHLVAGREFVSRPGTIGPAWLYDLVVYAVYSVAGGGALVLVKALASGTIALLIFQMSRARGGRLLPLAISGLAVLALGSRVLLHPATFSAFFLTVAVRLLFRAPRPADRPRARCPDWYLVALFVVWGNVDQNVVIGLCVVALIEFGRLLDARSSGAFGSELGRMVARIAVLVVAACAGPAHVHNLQVPAELKRALAALHEEGGGGAVNSPFTREFFASFRESPVVLSYFPLLGLGLVSFLLNRKAWHWAWVLPWIGLALVSGIQVRLVPFFAVVAGPVTAWNFVTYFTGREAPALVRPRVRFALRGLTVALAVGFLVAAWPGWLQAPPFEPRRWAVEPPSAVLDGAAFLRRAHASNLWPQESRTLYLSSETASMLAWFCPEDRGLRDEDAVKELLKTDVPEKARQQLRALGVSRVVAFVAETDGSAREARARLLADPDEWPVLHLTGGLVVFGWRDPARGRGADPYEGRGVDFTGRAFRPGDEDRAPGARPAGRRWWDAFWKPAPASRPAGRDEALVLLEKAEAMLGSAPQRHLSVWVPGQMGGLVGAASGWSTPAGALDATIRGAFVRPPLVRNAPPPQVAQLALGFEQRFEYDRGSAPVGILYVAARAARRAVAENPNDATAYFALGRIYAALVRITSEQSWAGRVPDLVRLRQIQASAALNRAVALDPNLAEAHIALGQLYLTIKYLDLAAAHLRAYRDVPASRGGPKKGDRRAAEILAELDRLTKEVDEQTRAFANESARSSVGDRAIMADRRGLAGAARDLLLKSDVSAFGTQGMELELNLLLRTGRPEDVLEWTTPELEGSLGGFTYHWLRAQSHIALGDYAAADTELGEIIEPGSLLVVPSPVGTEVAGVVGKALLDAQPSTSFTSQVVMRALSEFDLRTRMTQIGLKLSQVADMSVLRGVIALEAGTIDRARDSFRAALTYSPERWAGGQLEFPGRWVAWAGLALIESAEAKPARAP